MISSNRYDIDHKSNRFFEFVSREMMRKNKNKSYADESKNNRNLMLDTTSKEGNSDKNNMVAEIYSQSQLSRYRRGASMLRSNSNHNSSLSKNKREMKESCLNFYEGLKSKQRRPRAKQETSPNVNASSDQDCNIEQLHYQMVEMHQNLKKLQKNI